MSLHLLSLEDNQIKEIPDEICNLKNVQLLYLANNQISKIEGLKNLAKLTTLSLADNMIKSIKGMDKLQNLYSKDLFNNRVMSIEGLETLTSLERFIVKKEPFSGFPI